MWQTMAKLFHPQWTKNNGEIGGQVFRDWTVELERFGSDGVLRGIDSVRGSGSSYAPNLNKFIGHCLDNYSQPAGQVGEWEKCPYTGRRRRLKPGHEELAKRLETDPRTHEQIRQDIEAYIANGQTNEAAMEF